MRRSLPDQPREIARAAHDAATGPVRTTRSARRRFSASGICRASTASDLRRRPCCRRRRTRAICTAARRRHHHHPVHAPLARRFPAAAEYPAPRCARRPGGRGPGRPLLAPHHRVEDRFQPRQRVAARRARGRAARRGPARAGPRVDPTVPGNAGSIARSAAPAWRLQPVHRGVGVEHRDAGAAEGGGGGRLAHADAAGQADHLHGAGRRPNRGGSAPHNHKMTHHDASARPGREIKYPTSPSPPCPPAWPTFVPQPALPEVRMPLKRRTMLAAAAGACRPGDRSCPARDRHRVLLPGRGRRPDHPHRGRATPPTSCRRTRT